MPREQLTVFIDVVAQSSDSTLPCKFALFYARAEGWAHGSRWYANVLAVDRRAEELDYSFPMTVLVEEGEACHGS